MITYIECTCVVIRTRIICKLELIFHNEDNCYYDYIFEKLIIIVEYMIFFLTTKLQLVKFKY